MSNDSESPSPSSGSSHLAFNFSKRIATKAIGGVHGLSDEYIIGRQRKVGNVQDSKRATLAAFVSGLSEIGLEKLTGESANTYMDNSQEVYTPLPPGEAKAHFSDKLLDKMVTKISGAQERQTLRKRLNDTRRADQPPLSVTTLVYNFRTLSFKMSLFFGIQRYLISIWTWENGYKTLTFLLLYTIACMWPFMFLIYPLLGIVVLQLLPAYIDRHPLDKPELIPERKRGASSTIGFLGVTKDDVEYSEEGDRLGKSREAQFEKSLRDQGYFGSQLTPTTSATSVAPVDEETQQLIEEIEEEKEDEDSKSEEPSNFMDKMSVLISMRDLQNLTTNVIKSLDAGEDYVHHYCSFANETTSTLLFFGLIGLTAIVCVLGPYIPWRGIFILAGWVALLFGHPKRAELLDQFSSSETGTKTTKSIAKTRDYVTGQIVVDEQIRYRKVCIFQIDVQDVKDLETYTLFSYSPSTFTASSSARLQRKKPLGTAQLQLVRAPSKNWRFVENKSWEVDPDSYSWCEELGIIDEVRIDDSDGWVYDQGGEYRRRRLMREVYRVGR